MRALLYLTKRTFINKLKKALHKPVSLIIIIGGVIYGMFIAAMLGKLVSSVQFNSVKGLVVIITIWTLYIFLANFSSYSSRKGIIFRPSHAHFIFPAPIGPKLVLLHGAWMNYLVSMIVCFLFVIAGFTVFRIEAWKVLLFFLVECVLETIFEVSVMVFLYTNDRIPEKAIKFLGRTIKVLLLGITVFIVLYYKKYGVTLDSASAFIDWPGLQMIPLVGWNIAVYRLILLGPTMLNVICSVLYLLTVIAAFLIAWRMKCEGGYYEDAAKFADDYAEMRKRKVNGEMVMSIGEKKKKFRRVNESIQSTGAKAIFYRQLLEYKKEKFFIFSKMTVLCLGIAIFLSMLLRDSAMKSGMPQMYLMGIILYMSLVLSSYLGKWEKELKSPYLFMIPDSPIRKLWYSTLMEHIKALADACILCIPLGIAWRIHPIQVLMAILTYTVLQANKMYSRVVAQCLLGDTLGKRGQEIVRAVIQMSILGIGAAVAALAGVFINVDLIFPIILIYSMIVTAVIGMLASIRFYSMEQLV